MSMAHFCPRLIHWYLSYCDRFLQHSILKWPIKAVAIHRLRLVVAQMLTTAKMAVARKKAKRRSQRVVNDIHRAHRAVTVVNQVIRVVVNRQVVATHRLHQVNSMNHAHNQYLVHLSRVCYTHFTLLTETESHKYHPISFYCECTSNLWQPECHWCTHHPSISLDTWNIILSFLF